MKTVTHFDLSTYLSFRMGPIIDTVFIIEKDQEIEDIFHLYPNASILGGGTNTLVGKEKAQDVWLINQMMGWQCHVLHSKQNIVFSVFVSSYTKLAGGFVEILGSGFRLLFCHMIDFFFYFFC